MTRQTLSKQNPQCDWSQVILAAEGNLCNLSSTFPV